MAKIRTQYDPKPIPIRSFDWEALEDDYEPGRPIGFGKTEAEAIDDLNEQLEVEADKIAEEREINDVDYRYWLE